MFSWTLVGARHLTVLITDSLTPGEETAERELGLLKATQQGGWETPEAPALSVAPHAFQ